MPKPTQVDESLFGKPARKTQRATLPTNSVVVSASELARIRERTIVRTVADESREREARQAEFEKKKVQARMRKEKMQKMEAASKVHAKKSDGEMAKLTREKTIREYANKLVRRGAGEFLLSLRKRKRWQKREREKNLAATPPDE